MSPSGQKQIVVNLDLFCFVLQNSSFEPTNMAKLIKTVTSNGVAYALFRAYHETFINNTPLMQHESTLKFNMWCC